MSPLEQKIAALTAEVNEKPTILESAEAYIAGVPGIVQQAISDAITAGAAPGVLGAFAVLVQALQVEADALIQALTANVIQDGPAAASQDGPWTPGDMQAPVQHPLGFMGGYPDITPVPPSNAFATGTQPFNAPAGDYADMLTDIQDNEEASIAEQSRHHVLPELIAMESMLQEDAEINTVPSPPATEDMPF